MSISCRHIALVVADLQTAEAYYRGLLGMNLIGREARLEDGFWYTLPFGQEWEDARAAGVELGMAALRAGDMVLALFAGDAPPGQVFAIGLRVSAEAIAGIRARLTGESVVLSDGPGGLEFLDPYGITWQIGLPEAEFRTAGVFAGRWIAL